MKITSLLMLTALFLTIGGNLFADDCRTLCNQEYAKCVAAVGDMEPKTDDEKQRLADCRNEQVDCHSKCAENADVPAEPPKEEPEK